MNLFHEAKKVLDKDGKVNPLGPYGKMKLTGQEVANYFRKNKVSDAKVKKAVEVALDMSGADTIARQEIKKFYGDKILKSKEVQNALQYANEETIIEKMKMKDIFKKHKRELTKAYKSGDLSFMSPAARKAEDDLMQWAMDNGEVKTDDPDDFFDWLSRDLEDIVKGKIKEDVSEKFSPYLSQQFPRCVDFYIQFRGGKGDRITSEENKKDFIKATDMIDAYCKKNKIKQKPVYSTPMEGSSAYKVGLMIDKTYSKTDDYDRGVDLQPLYVELSKLKTAEDHGGGWSQAVVKESSMDGSKLTGQEISVYFRRHKVRDKMTRKAVEYALDHGGAMKYAIKGIEKMKKGLSKNKDVQKALNYANYGTEQKVPEVGFMFKEDSPIAGNMQVEGDPYIPQKKGVNKNIANYWKKEIKGISQKELEAVQSMYMITDHSGVVQMYKAGKRAFIKSLK